MRRTVMFAVSLAGGIHAASSVRRQSSQSAAWTAFHCVHRAGADGHCAGGIAAVSAAMLLP
jgi:hypothetical protein